MHFDIILPTIGRDSLLATVDSVTQQDYPYWKLWIICDGIDGLGCIGILDERIEYIGSQEHRHEDYGAWARNKGVSLGTNPWIAYIDDDDIWHKGHLSVLSSLHEAHPQATMLRTAGQAFSFRRKTPRTKKRVRKRGAINSTDILTVGMAHTRELFELTEGWRPEDNHDKLLWQAMQKAGGLPVESTLVTFEFER